MIVIGITGGIGSGKSTVCRMLAARGARIFYADLEARFIMERNGRVRNDLSRVLGRDVYHADNSLDRRLFASRMFRDAALVAQVNAIVHPRVHRAFASARRRAEAEGVGVFVKEAALLLDSGSAARLDAIVVVAAPSDERVRRVAARESWDEEAVRARIVHQRSDAEFRAAADYVIENDGTLDDLGVRVDALWAMLNAPGGVRSLRRSATEKR